MRKIKKTSIIEKLYAFLLFSGVLFSSAVLSNSVTEADNLFGERCGPNLVCSGEQTCQIQYNGQPVGTLPGQTTINLDPVTGEPITDISYQCIDPPQLPAPNGSPYNSGQVNGYNTATPRPSDPGVPVNIINQGPVPVDIFNPLPVPTNIVSPNPIPVVVVDDLALYQQARIDEYVTDQTRQQTLIEGTEVAKQEIVRQGSYAANPLNVDNTVATQSALEATTQEVVQNQAPFVDTSQSLDILNNVAQQMIDTGGKAMGLQASRYAEFCPPDPTNSGLLCTTLAMSELPINTTLENVSNLRENYDIAKEERTKQFLAGDGFYPITDQQNIFEQTVKTQGIVVAGTLQRFVESQIDRVLGASGNCTEAQGGALFEETIEKTLSDGLFQLSDAVDLSTIDINNPQDGLQQIGETLKQTGQSIFEALINGVSCELGNFVGSVIDDWLGQIIEI
jgi:hypothetical protein